MPIDKKLKPPKLKNVNPNPEKFNILRKQAVNNHLVLEVYYNGCTNMKEEILLINTSKVPQVLDPYFNEKSNLFARFVPTEDG